MFIKYCLRLKKVNFLWDSRLEIVPGWSFSVQWYIDIQGYFLALNINISIRETIYLDPTDTLPPKFLPNCQLIKSGKMVGKSTISAYLPMKSQPLKRTIRSLGFRKVRANQNPKSSSCRTEIRDLKKPRKEWRYHQQLGAGELETNLERLIAIRKLEDNLFRFAPTVPSDGRNWERLKDADEAWGERERESSIEMRSWEGESFCWNSEIFGERSWRFGARGMHVYLKENTYLTYCDQGRSPCKAT